MALGAGRGSVMALVLRDVALMVACGVALGSAAAAMTTGLARPLLFGLTPTEPAVFAIAAGVLAGACLTLALLGSQPDNRITIRVHADARRGPMTQMWAFFGYDEPNYT